MTNLRKTFFLDIDGTLVKHTGLGLSEGMLVPVKLCPGVREKLDEMEHAGHCIILTTARRESLRCLTVKQLESLGIFYDQLIMGIGHGERVVVNDMSSTGEKRARGVNIVRDEGLANLEI